MDRLAAERDALQAERDQRAADVAELVSLVQEALDEIDPRYSLGSVLEEKLNGALEKVRGWLPREVK